MKLRSILTSASMILVLGLFAAAHLLTPDRDVSVSERRPLEQLPTVTLQSVMNGKFGEDLEDYLLDQFPLREELRKLKAAWHFDVYKQSDNNGIYLVGDQVLKLDAALKEEEVNALISNTNKVYESYLQGMNVSFALIPDKNFFLSQPSGYPTLDYAHMQQLLQNGLTENIKYLGMTPFDSLSLDDYYRTDLHWKQESLQGVVNALAQALDCKPMELDFCSQTDYSPFYGSYYGQSALNIDPDVLTALTNDTLAGCIVTSPEYKGEKPVYDDDDFEEMDGYNVFLGGPLGMVTVENPAGTTGKELIIFRDSFASSLAPLLMEGYDKITLIDLRYLASINVGRFVEFTDQDVLFLYSTNLVNNGKLLK